MGGAVNGMAAHGGIVRPYGSTFMQFADYMRGAIRLSALTGLPSRGSSRTTRSRSARTARRTSPSSTSPRCARSPGSSCCAPADAHETAEAWRVILEDLEGPAALALSRQDLPVLDRATYGAADGVGKGAYVLADADDAAGDDHRHRQRGLGRARRRRRARRAGARRLDAVVGAVRAAGRGLPGRPSCRSTCRPSPSRPASGWAGSATPTRSSRSTASAPRRRARRAREARHHAGERRRARARAARADRRSLAALRARAPRPAGPRPRTPSRGSPPARAPRR